MNAYNFKFKGIHAVFSRYSIFTGSARVFSRPCFQVANIASDPSIFRCHGYIYVLAANSDDVDSDNCSTLLAPADSRSVPKNANRDEFDPCFDDDP